MRTSLALAIAIIFLPNAALAQSNAQQAESVRYQACLERSQSEPNESLEDALAWLYAGGGWPAAHCHARSLVALGDIRTGASMLEALASRQHAGMLAHERLDLWTEAGEAWLSANMFSDAEAAFNVALIVDDRALAARAGRAGARIALGEWNDALADTQALIEQRPRMAQAWRLNAQVQLGLENLSAARSAILRAVHLEPDNIDGLVLRGQINEAVRLTASF